jgi:hypothetical protein
VPPWLPRSADLSPIEHVWDMIRRKISNLARPPQTLAQLRYEVQIAWDSVSQEDMDCLIRSILRRVAECINTRGGATH